MKKRLILLLSVVIGICTLGLIVAQVKWIQTTAGAEKDKFSRTVQSVLEKVIADVDRQEQVGLTEGSVPLRVFQTHEQPTGQHSDSIAKWMEQRLSPHRMDSLLHHAFRAHHLAIDYDFAVTDAAGAILFETLGFDHATPELTYSVALFPNNRNEEVSYNLSVYLAQYHHHILYSMMGFMVASALLTLIIVGTFAATLIIIFRQKRLSEIKTDFVSNITHELKTPITTISLAAQMLQDPAVFNTPAGVPRMAGMIGSESKRLLHLVESVLQSAVFERGKVKLSMKKTQMHTMIKEVLALFSVQFEALHITVELHLQAPNATVMGDEVHLANVLSNLIDNAIKYRKADVPLHIVVETGTRQAVLTVAVTDNGIGIESRSTKHLFEQFYRHPTENVHTIKGFGLGLYYVRNIIETHNGRLFAFGKTGKGSTFGFELPLSTP